MLQVKLEIFSWLLILMFNLTNAKCFTGLASKRKKDIIANG